jgi:hypothetical protein
MLVPLALAAMMFTPGAQTSGLTRKSAVGPWLEKYATSSAFVVAPTVIAFLETAGIPTVGIL